MTARPSDTPRTDEAEDSCRECRLSFVLAADARKVERELNAARNMGNLSGIKIVPVDTSHEHYPADELCMKFDRASGVAYVRQEDWPLIRDELRKNFPQEPK